MNRKANESSFNDKSYFLRDLKSCLKVRLLLSSVRIIAINAHLVASGNVFRRIISRNR